MRGSNKIDSGQIRDRTPNEKHRWRRRRFLWLTAGAFVTTGTIASISPPAYSPTFASPPNNTSLSQASASPTPSDYVLRESDAPFGRSPDISHTALGKRLLAGVRPEDALRALAADHSEREHYEVRVARVAGVIERSLFDDGEEAGLSDRLITELAEIFGWDIDFVLDLRPGDRFAVLHEEKYWLGRKVADGDILAAEFVNQGRVFRAIGYRTPEGRMQYYSPEGFALQREFLRTPVKFSRVSSLFSDSRYHPILKTWRAHHGVDYDAPLGTPVRATASGRIIAAGWNGGYGKMVTIRHAGPYSTVYAHLARYRPGLRAGQVVQQGDIIGYVGRTGLASAPHLHYELQVNGAHLDPLTFEVPPSRRAAIPPDTRHLFLQKAAVWSTKLNIGDEQLAQAP